MDGMRKNRENNLKKSGYLKNYSRNPGKKLNKNDGDWFVNIICQTDEKNVLLDFSEEMELNNTRG